MITDYLMITEKFNKLQVIMITDYNQPKTVALCWCRPHALCPLILSTLFAYVPQKK